MNVCFMAKEAALQEVIIGPTFSVLETFMLKFPNPAHIMNNVKLCIGQKKKKTDVPL